MLPKNQNTFKTEDFLRFANEEMDMAIIPYVMSFHEDYFLTSSDTDLQMNISRYSIPYRAAGNKLNDVAYVDNSGTIFEMTRITKGDAPYYQYGPLGSLSSRIRSFYLEGDQVVLLPEVNTIIGGFLRMSYYLRPNQLVSKDRIATIVAIDTVTGNIIVDQLPEHFKVGDNLDILQTKSPHKTIKFDIPVLAIDTLTKTITIDPTNVPSTAVVGDYLASAEECLIPQIPTDLHSMLAQRVACRCLEAMGDQAGLQAANAKLAEMELKGGTIIDSRVESAPFKVLNRHGFLRTARRYIRR
jgi:hypothetical protein